MSSTYYRLLNKTAGLRDVLKRAAMFRWLMTRLGGAALWLNHFRRQVLVTVDGITFELDLNEAIDSNIYASGMFEPELTMAMAVLTKPGDCVLDIGANIGCHALRFAKLVDPAGRVFAFEPTAYALEKMQRNLALNPDLAANVTLEKLAIAPYSARAQKIRFKSSWRLYGRQREIPEEVVDFVSIDDFVAQRGLNRVDILKIDVDGYEPAVVASAARTLRDFSPIIFLEINDTAELQSLLQALWELGYVFLFEENFSPVASTADVQGLVMQRPINSTGYRGANFILLPAATAKALAAALRRAMAAMGPNPGI